MENTQLQEMQQQDTLVEKLVQVNRVAKTVKGGRVMSFTAVKDITLPPLTVLATLFTCTSFSTSVSCCCISCN